AAAGGTGRGSGWCRSSSLDGGGRQARQARPPMMTATRHPPGPALPPMPGPCPRRRPGRGADLRSHGTVYWILSNELADEDRDADLRGTFTTDSGRDVSFDDGASVAGAVAHARYTLTAPPDGQLCDHLPVGEIPGLVLSERLCAVL